MEELQQRLRDLESQKSVLFESGAADQVEVGRINEKIREIESQIGRQAQQEVKIAEVDEMELPFDFDADFGTVGVNQIVRQMIKEERSSNYSDFDAEYERLIIDYGDKLKGAEERELQLSRQNDYLNSEVERLAGTAQTESQRANELQAFVDMQKITIAEKDKEIYNLNQRNDEIEQYRKNGANRLVEVENELLRLEDQLDEMRRANVFGERKAQQIIEVTPTTNELYEKAKRATAEKRQIIITGTLGANFNTVQLPDGGTDVLHKDVIAQGYEVVDSFLEYFDAPEISKHVPDGIYQGISQSDMGDRGCKDQVEGVSDAEESYTLPTNESTEAAQETQDSEEAAKENEFVTRREFNNFVGVINNTLAALAHRTGGLITEDEMNTESEAA